MVHVGTYNAHIDINAHLVLELLNHSNQTPGSRADFGIFKPFLDLQGNSRSIL
jgi:hypothetical protein